MAGSAVGPWCTYFAPWVAAQNGKPLGDNGQGFGRLIIWDEQIGIVESVSPDGRIQTVEGNSSDQVCQRS